MVTIYNVNKFIFMMLKKIKKTGIHIIIKISQKISHYIFIEK